MMQLNFSYIKRIAIPVICLLIVFISACKKNTPDPEITYDVNQEYNLQNISYGSDNQQSICIDPRWWMECW
jgi:hypothetical protein